MPKAGLSDFVTYVLDMLAPLGRVAAGRMFGGYNVTLDGLTFGIIIGDVLFLKTDDDSRPRFQELSLAPFSYRKKTGIVMVTSYFTAPDCLDDWDALEPFARSALAAARRAKAAKAPKRAAAEKRATKKPAPKKSPAKRAGAR